MSEQEEGEKNFVNHCITHSLNNNLNNEQYCFLQIQSWTNTKNMQWMCGHWHCSLWHFGKISPSLVSDSLHTPSTYKHFSRTAGGLKSSQIIDSQATKKAFEWIFWGGNQWAWLAHAETWGPGWGEGAFERGLNAPCSRKKASQQNYKPEKISVLRHWEQNGFCFLEDNELTRAHHTEQDNHRGRKYYHWWNDAIFLSEYLLYVCLLNSWWIFMTFKVARRLHDVFKKKKNQRSVWAWACILWFAERDLYIFI